MNLRSGGRLADGRPADGRPADDGSAFRIADLLDCLGRWARGTQFSHGLNPAQWESLRFLGRANRLSRTPGALAKYLGATRGTASQTVQALEKKGYLTRVADTADRRMVHLDLTDAGITLLRDDPLSCIDNRLSETIEPASVTEITNSLTLLMEWFQEAGLGQNFGTCVHCGFYEKGSGAAAQCTLKNLELSVEDAAGICVNFQRRESEPARV